MVFTLDSHLKSRQKTSSFRASMTVICRALVLRGAFRSSVESRFRAIMSSFSPAPQTVRMCSCSQEQNTTGVFPTVPWTVHLRHTVPQDKDKKTFHYKILPLRIRSCTDKHQGQVPMSPQRKGQNERAGDEHLHDLMLKPILMDTSVAT